MDGKGESGGEGGADDEDVGNSMPEIVRWLADSGAAELQDEGGMVRKLSQISVFTFALSFHHLLIFR